MKYQSSQTKIIHELTFDESRRKRYKCPECSHKSKRKSPKDLEYYPDSKTSYCHKCETTLFEYKPYEKKKEYKVPEWRNKTKLSDKAVKYFNGRMISQDTLIKMQVFTDNEYMPQFEKTIEVICFPFFVDNKQVNIKFRGARKSFKLVSGAELIWYNFNAIKDNKEIIICEGEMDALTWIENGYDNVISVPNGAGNNLEYLDSSVEMFNDIDKIYLSTDCDAAGIQLRDELTRRLGADKCYLVNFKQHKDSNAYFMSEGGIAFKELIPDSAPAPIKGIVKVESILDEILELYEKGEQPGLSIGSEEIDKFITWELGRLAVVTGIPQSGKSEFVDSIVARLNLNYGWKAAYFTPENYPLKYHYRKLHTKLSGRKFDKQTDDTDFYTIYEHIKENYFYIMDEDNMTVETVIESAKALVKQKGIKILVIDPYNKLEHSNDSRTSETQYISKFLDELIKFAKFNNVLLFLIAHPRKMMRGDVPTLYDIAGSANFYNKTDYGFTVHRLSNEDGAMNSNVEVHWQKIKFKHLGEQGVSQLTYNVNNGRYESFEEANKGWDNSNWLTGDSVKKDQLQIQDNSDLTVNPDLWYESKVTEEEAPF